MHKANRLTKRFGGNQANDRFGKVPSMKKGCFIDGLFTGPLLLGQPEPYSVMVHGPKMIRDGIARLCKVFFGFFAIVG